MFLASASLCCLTFDVLAKQRDGFGGLAWPDAEDALDDAGCTAHVTRQIEDCRLSLAQGAHHLKSFDRRTGCFQRLETAHGADQLFASETRR